MPPKGFRIVALLMASLAEAQTPPAVPAATPSLEPVKTVVTVTARPEPVETGAADVTIVEPQKTPAATPQSLADVLRFQPALYVGQTGQRGGLTSISLRGGDPNFTLFLLDGIPVNDITDQLGGTVDLSTILPFQEGHVELVRGPMSVLYGSEAIAGVVNYISHDAPQHHVTLRLAGGSFGTFEGGLAVGGRSGRFGYTLGIAGVRIGEQVERDSLDAIDAGGRTTIALARNMSLGLTFRVRRSDATDFPANSGGPKYALDRLLETRDATSETGGVEWKFAAGRWSHWIGFDIFRQAQDENTPAIYDRLPPSFQTVPATLSDVTFRRARVNLSTSTRIAHGWSTTVGFALRDESGENAGSIKGYGPANYRLDRQTAAIFGETVLERRRWSVIAGVRSDWITGGYRRVSPRVGASAAMPWRGGRVRASWGRGFKMPSFYALGQPFVGNPQLKPETSDAADLGLEQRLGRRMGLLSANLFRSVYSDLIDFSPQLFRLVNRTSAEARGADFSWRLSFREGALVQVHATYSSAHLQNSAEALRDRPRWRTGAVLSLPLGSRTSVYAEGLWVASRFDFQLPVPQYDRAPSYFVANFGGRRKITDAVSAFARIDNFLNRQYQEYVGFPNPGIQVRAGFDYHWR